MLLGRFRIGVVVVVAASVLALPASALAWSWGYNYQTPTTNSYVESDYADWNHLALDKNSGGTVATGWFPGSGTCYRYSWGSMTWSVSAADWGCHGVKRAYSQYWSGSSSYLYVATVT